MDAKNPPLAVALFEAYSRNCGNPPDCHYDRNAAEQWMAQALDECGVAEMIEAAKGVLPFVVYQVLEHCNGNKCRDSWCAGCSGDEEAEQAVDEANRNSTRLYTALAAVEGKA
jgi:hypothetical protein